MKKFLSKKCNKFLLVLVLFTFVFTSVFAQPRLIKIMAANITSGNYQTYQTPGINIFKALKPDICCIQEFNNDKNISKDIDELVLQAFGSDFRYYREPYTNSGDIPNGIIYHKDFVVLDKGSWNDSQIPNRGFSYVRFDLPGNNPHLFVISVHLSTQSSKQSVEADNLRQYIFNYFNVSKPDDIPDYLVLAGDFNAGSRSATVVWKLTKDGLFIDQPIPVDQDGDSGTNSSRSKDHDFVLTNNKLHQYITPFNVGNNSFPNGLVFDSRVYNPLSDVYPVQRNDSGATNMQHMAVVKAYYVPCD